MAGTPFGPDVWVRLGLGQVPWVEMGRQGEATGGTSPRFCTRLPPPVEVGRRPPGGGGGGGGGLLGGGLAAEEGLPRGLASCC